MNFSAFSLCETLRASAVNPFGIVNELGDGRDARGTIAFVMPTAIEYASPSTPSAAGRVGGWISTVISVCSSAAMLALAFKMRVDIDTNSWGWCGTGRYNLQSELTMLPMLLILPSWALVAAYRAHTGVRICRTSLLIAVLGWAVCEFWG